MASSSQLRVYESIENLKRILGKKDGQWVPLEALRSISAYLTQGRQYFEAAGKSDLAIRPLIIYYGMLAYAGAIAIIRARDAADVLEIGDHGLKAKMKAARLLDFDVNIKRNGVFHLLNDAICDLQSASVLRNSEYSKERSAAIGSAVLSGRSISFQDLLSRIPGIDGVYEQTFGKPARVVACSAIQFYEPSGGNIDVFPGASAVRNEMDLRRFVNSFRKRFPIFDRLLLTQARKIDRFITLSFALTDRQGYNEFSNAKNSAPGIWDFHFRTDLPDTPSEAVLVPMAGAMQGEQQHLVAPFQVGYVADLSIVFMAMHVVSHIVRYRPNVWMHALTSASTDSNPPDDHAIALIEKLMDIAISRTTLVTSATISQN